MHTISWLDLLSKRKSVEFDFRKLFEQELPGYGYKSCTIIIFFKDLKRVYNVYTTPNICMLINIKNIETLLLVGHIFVRAAD